MSRNQLKLVILFTLLLVGLVGSAVLWLWAQKRQYAINRQLIAALEEGDNKEALILTTPQI